MTETVWLQRPSADVPWGFRLHGGRDYQTPLTVQKVTPGSIAATGLTQDDVILRIADTDTSALTYAQAMDVIKNSGNLLQLLIAKRGGQGAYRPQVEEASNMASGALHDLFEDMYRYTDMYGQEGALSHHPQPAPPSSALTPPSSTPSSSASASGATYPLLHSTSYTGSSFDHYGHDQPQAQQQQPPPVAPPYGLSVDRYPAPPSYADVQMHRDNVTYQPYAQSVSSSTSELSDVSSGIGNTGSATRAPTGGAPKPYTSASSVDSSSGFGSYSCETPDQSETGYKAQLATAGRQDSFPPPPPPLAQNEPQQPATRLEQQLSNMSINSDYGRQASYTSPVPQSPSHPPGAPTPPTPPAPAPYYGGAKTPTSPIISQPAGRPQHVIPDAVLNMAAKGEPDKKPWTYAPDMESIKEQRDKVRRSLKKDQGKDITQSPVYRMVHGLDADKPKSRRSMPAEDATRRAPKTPAEDDELSFSGVLDKSEIPSKTFHKLQSMTGGSEIDTTSIRQNISGEVPDDEIGVYDQASIRYTGKNIPSRSFKMLQSLTGDDLSVPAAQPRRQRRQRPEQQPEEPEQNPDDIVDISYVGGNIPSRSFKVLQHAVGEEDSSQPAKRREDDDDECYDGAAFDEMYYLGDSIPSRSFQLLQSAVGSDPNAVAQERRLRRRRRMSSRQSSRTEEEMTSVIKSDQPFDEQAYLAGQIPLNVDPVEKPKPKRVERAVSRELAPWEREDKQTEEDTTQNQEFDEEAYLSGRIPILGNEPKRALQHVVSQPVKSSPEEDENKDENKEPFNEEAYLAGRISILGGEPKPRPQKENEENGAQVPWKRLADEEKTEEKTEFDENAYLSGQITILGGDGRPKSGLPRGLLDKDKPQDEPEWVKRQRAKLTRKQRSKRDEFDEETFLGVQTKESSQEDENEEKEERIENFDEQAYLAGQITILGGTPAAPKREPKPATETRAPWQKAGEEDKNRDDGFDEEAYLQGKVPILRDSVPRELPPREINKNKKYRERAPWERPDDDDKPVDADKEFDEERFLAGRANSYVRKSVDRDMTSSTDSDDPFSKIPSRTFHYLRRSMSREISPASATSSDRPPSRQSSIDSADEEADPNKPYDEMVYVGNKIPSKAFLRLKKSVSKKSKKNTPVDPIEKIRERVAGSVDVDAAMEKLNIDQHDPDKYLEQLKQTVEANSNIKIEAVANEVTDF